MDDEEALIQLIIGNIQTENDPLTLGYNATKWGVQKDSKKGKSAAKYAKKIGAEERTVRDQINAAKVYFPLRRRKIKSLEQSEPRFRLLSEDEKIQKVKPLLIEETKKLIEIRKLPETDHDWANDFIIENKCSKQQVIAIVKAIKDFRNAVKVAVIEYIGYPYTEISRLADIDNENDEYHTEVLITDVWAEYARLRDEEKWKQDKIAEAKTLPTKKGKYDKTIISRRLKWHDTLPEEIKQKVVSELLTEKHLTHISGVVVPAQLSNWITSENTLTEISEWVASNKKNTRETKKECDRWKEFIAEADRQYNEFAAQDITLYEFPEDSARRVEASENAALAMVL